MALNPAQNNCDLLALLQQGSGGFCLAAGNIASSTNDSITSTVSTTTTDPTNVTSDTSTATNHGGHRNVGRELNEARVAGLGRIAEMLAWYADPNRAPNAGGCFTYGGSNTPPTSVLELASKEPNVIRG